MPISQLMRKLSGKLSDRSYSLKAPNNGEGPMDCSTSFEVVAEIVPRSPGSSSGSLCSASSRGAEEDTSDRTRTQNHHGALGASSASGPLPSLSSSVGQPANARALRALSKAMHRSASGLNLNNLQHTNSHPDLYQSHSLESSNSMEASPSAAYSQEAGPTTVHDKPASPRYTRASTYPLPGSSSHTGNRPAEAPVQGAAAGWAAPQAAAVAAAAGAEDWDAELVAPTSPVGAHDDEESDHCHWEDGVVASWLQAMDHSELLHSGPEDVAQVQPAAGAAHGPSKVASSGAAAHQLSSSVPNAVYSSLLYN